MFNPSLALLAVVSVAFLVGCQQPPGKTTSVTYKTINGTATVIPATSTTAPVVIQITPAPQPAQPPTPKVNTSPWIGKSIDDIVNVIGNFKAEVDMGNGVRAFQFQAKPKKPRCVASYLASRENEEKPWIVEEYIAPDPKTC